VTSLLVPAAGSGDSVRGQGEWNVEVENYGVFDRHPCRSGALEFLMMDETRFAGNIGNERARCQGETSRCRST
jgi:hypothetical protein